MEDNIEEIRKKMAEQIMTSKAPKPEANAQPQTLTDGTFQSFVSSPALTVVDFWAVWCAPCRFVSPIIEELSKKYAGKVQFGKLNVDENQMTSSRFGIRSIPTIMLFKNGRPVDVVIGAVPKNQIESKILQHM